MMWSHLVIESVTATLLSADRTVTPVWQGLHGVLKPMLYGFFEPKKVSSLEDTD